MRDANGDRDRKGVASDKRAAGNVTFPFCIYTPEHRLPSIILLSLQTNSHRRKNRSRTGRCSRWVYHGLFAGASVCLARSNDEVCACVYVCVCVCSHVAYVVRYAEKWSHWAIDGVARCLG